MIDLFLTEWNQGPSGDTWQKQVRLIYLVFLMCGRKELVPLLDIAYSTFLDIEVEAKLI
jgi:hypothetical protein